MAMLDSAAAAMSTSAWTGMEKAMLAIESCAESWPLAVRPNFWMLALRARESRLLYADLRFS